MLVHCRSHALAVLGWIRGRVWGHFTRGARVNLRRLFLTMFVNLALALVSKHAGGVVFCSCSEAFWGLAANARKSGHPLVEEARPGSGTARRVSSRLAGGSGFRRNPSLETPFHSMFAYRRGGTCNSQDSGAEEALE